MSKHHMYEIFLNIDGNSQEHLSWQQGIEYQEHYGMLSSINQEMQVAHGSYCQEHIL